MKELDMNELDNVAGGWRGIDKGDLFDIYMKSAISNEQSKLEYMAREVLSNFEGGALEVWGCDQDNNIIRVMAKLKNDKYSNRTFCDVLKDYLKSQGFCDIVITIHD